MAAPAAPAADKKVRALAMAVLADKGTPQKAIANILNSSQPEVSRCLKAAEKAGHLARYRLIAADLDPELLKQAKELIERRSLVHEVEGACAAISAPNRTSVKSVAIDPALRREGKPEEIFRDRCRSLARRGADHLGKQFRENLVVGVSFGHTNHYFVRAIGAKSDKRPLPGLRVFPLLGSLPYLDHPYPIDLTSDAIAHELMIAFSSSDHPNQHALGLSAVPMFLPRQFEQHRRDFESFFKLLPAFRQIYGGDSSGQPALAATANMLLVGAGDLKSGKAGSRYIHSRLDLEGFDARAMSKLSAGDLGGIFLPRPGLSAAGSAEVAGINQRLLGLRMQHLLDCSERAQLPKSDSPGVVVLTHGATRASVVQEAIRLRLVNQLVIDEDLARALVDIAR